jgi:hypothetical protein
VSDKFIKLTSSDDSTAVLLNTKYVIKATRGEDDEYTTVILEESYDDVEVEETPEKIYSLITKPEKTLGSQSLSDGTPQKASVQTLTNDSHMENLAKHA